MPLRLNGSESGYVELTAPANAGNNSIVLPSDGITLVSTNGTQTLTNKTLTSSTISGGTITTGNITTFSTGGTAAPIDYTGIPSWAKKITVMFDGVSVNGTDNILIQLGTSSGVETTSYSFYGAYLTDASQTSITSTSGFLVTIGNALTVIYGSVQISLMGSNIWICSYGVGGVLGAANYGFTGGGRKALSGTLDRVRITVTGSNLFDLGSVNIMYEG